MSSSKVTQLHLLQQNLDSLVSQTQQTESQLTEMESALTELQSTSQAYKIVGKIMLAADKTALLKELQNKKDLTFIRFQNLKKQSEILKKNIDVLQKEVLEEMNKTSPNEGKGK